MNCSFRLLLFDFGQITQFLSQSSIFISYAIDLIKQLFSAEIIYTVLLLQFGNLSLSWF